MSTKNATTVLRSPPRACGPIEKQLFKDSPIFFFTPMKKLKVNRKVKQNLRSRFEASGGHFVFSSSTSAAQSFPRRKNSFNFWPKQNRSRQKRGNFLFYSFTLNGPWSKNQTWDRSNKGIRFCTPVFYYLTSLLHYVCPQMFAARTDFLLHAGNARARQQALFSYHQRPKRRIWTRVLTEWIEPRSPAQQANALSFTPLPLKTKLC